MTAPVIYWMRRDFRLRDNPALAAALARGGPVIPLFLCDEVVEALGAAPKWRIGLAAERFARTLEEHGSRLIARRGKALECLDDLVRETGATAVVWSRAYTPDQIERDKSVKAGLQAKGIEAQSVPGHLLFEPWDVKTRTGGFYKVFTPMWKTVRDWEVPAPLSPPSSLAPPAIWPDSEAIADWSLGAAMNRGASVVAPHLAVGEAAAADRLQRFLEEGIATYSERRDLPAVAGTSLLSENLAYGEIGPRVPWQAGWEALRKGAPGAADFLKELVWREFAYHLAWHTPRLLSGNWKPEWDGFAWRGENADTERWKQGRTGVRFVDAAMREMHVTGRMHNRARMIVASFLTKHLLTDWRIGADWFAEHLVDWDPAANAMGWQWAAGSGPDASPFFRIFNPDTQLEKFDKKGAYAAKFIAEQARSPDPLALRFFDAVPRSWGLSPRDAYPQPVVDLARGRVRALDAYEALRKG